MFKKYNNLVTATDGKKKHMNALLSYFIYFF